MVTELGSRQPHAPPESGDSAGQGPALRESERRKPAQRANAATPRSGIGPKQPPKERTRNRPPCGRRREQKTRSDAASAARTPARDALRPEAPRRNLKKILIMQRVLMVLRVGWVGLNCHNCNQICTLKCFWDWQVQPTRSGGGHATSRPLGRRSGYQGLS